MDACAQKELLDKGELSATELLVTTIDRIETIDPKINAVIHRLYEKASESIRDSDDAGPFSGIPLLLKDAICHTAGDPMHEGMGFLKQRSWTEDADSFLAARFRRAGFVFVGKTNLPELALAPTTEPIAYGPTRNPWQLERSTGGSSGGAAAAVAAGMVAVAHANDWAGSIRIPASACGVVGLKPSRGRVSSGPRRSPHVGGRGAEHVVTRSVRDCAGVLDAIAGLEPGDPYCAGDVDGSFSAHLRSSKRLRVGVFTGDHIDGVTIHDDCKTAVMNVSSSLQDLGHRVDEAWPAELDAGMAGHLASVYGSHALSMLETWSERTGDEITQDDVEAETWAWAELGRSTSAARYIADKEWLGQWGRELASWWRGYDVLITPTLVEPPPLLGELATDPADPWRVIAAQGRFGLFTAPWNVSGQPAMSLPTHVAGGLPIGVQLVAAGGREDVLISLAAEIEQALPWRDRRPQLG
ncbi:MAG: amidase [Actinomycetota bacterium]|nr:amidase [Actinomycetota bacterium]